MTAKCWNSDDGASVFVKFDAVPSAGARQTLKQNGFKYNSRARRWSAPHTKQRYKVGVEIADAENGVATAASSSQSQRPAPKAASKQRPATAPAQESKQPQHQSASQPPAKDRPVPTRGSNANFPWLPDDRQPNPQQEAVIRNAEGPELVIAGPGTGKTATIVNRVVHLVYNLGVDPSEIMVATYTTKAAHELVSRIASAFARISTPPNLDKMRIGTFHALCLEILREYSRSPEMRNMTVTSDLNECYQIARLWPGFEELEQAALFKTPWGKNSYGYQLAKSFSGVYANIVEEGVELTALENSEDGELQEIARFLRSYIDFAANERSFTFADIQARTLQMFEERPNTLEDLQRKVRYLIVDEYQDANSIQEKLVMAIAGDAHNVCVVGDDDQSLYRFRGANIENILHFASLFLDRKDDVKLELNYRSRPGIIKFYSDWMRETHYGPNGSEGFDWNGARLDKAIEAARGDNGSGVPAVMKCTGTSEADWRVKILELIKSLRRASGYTDDSQIVFICHSPKHPTMLALAEYLEENGVRVYSPRAAQMPEREEVRLAIGCLLECFKNASYQAGSGNRGYYDNCRNLARTMREQYPDLNGWISEKAASAPKKSKQGDHVLLDMFYEMLGHEPFFSWVQADGWSSLGNTMKARNLAALASLLDQFETSMAEHDERGWGNKSDYLVRTFFNSHFSGLQTTKSLNEQEDEDDPAPRSPRFCSWPAVLTLSSGVSHRLP